LVALAAAFANVATVPAVGAQATEAPVSLRDAERSIRDAQWAVVALYEPLATVGFQRLPRTGGTLLPPRGAVAPCDETTGDDCFGGQRECLEACAFWPSRDDMSKLATRYDSVAARVARAAPGVSPRLLDWLAGQRVGVWARLGELVKARRAADECIATVAWCIALHGFVYHLEGKYVLAEEHFRTFLRSVPDEVVCYWNEVTLYHDSLGNSIRYGGDGDRCASLNGHELFWTLADPLFSMPGNDRRSEHYARHVDMRIHEQWLELVGGYHNLAHHSVVLRHGWPTGVMPQGRSRKLLYGGGAQGFIIRQPVAEALRAPESVFVPAPGGNGETYRPRYGPIEAIPQQAGFFRNNGRATLVVRSRIPQSARRDPKQWSFRSWNGERFRDAPAAVEGNELTVWLPSPWEPQIVSIEAVSGDGAFRARSGTNPPDSTGTVVLSSLVILDGGDGDPGSLEGAVRRMRPSTTISRDQPVAVYWELYSDSPMTADVELTTTPLDRRGFFGRLLGLGPRAAGRVRWQEEVQPTGGVSRRAIALDIQTLPEGDYELRVRIGTIDGAVLESKAHVSVRAR
jgi:hypothetical protein